MFTSDRLTLTYTMSAEVTSSKKKRMAVPLEANPDIFNPFALTHGLDTSQLCFHDLLGFDDELIALVPKPIRAIILLYPGVEKTMHRKQTVQGTVDRQRLVHIRQRVGNVCGFMARLHARNMAVLSLMINISPGNDSCLGKHC